MRSSVIQFLKQDFEQNPRMLSRTQLLAFRLGNYAHWEATPGILRIGLMVVAKLMTTFTMIILGNSEVPFGVRIGQGLRLPHGFSGIVINRNVTIGSNVTIYHQVTIGSRTTLSAGTDKLPNIGDEVVIYSGAKIVGGIQIGRGAVIGANAVVTNDVPEQSIAIGVPARIVQRDKVNRSDAGD